MTDDVPDGLHERGAALWRSLALPATSAAGVVALEACRVADRLDELDRVIAGKGVLNLMQFRLNIDLDGDGDGEPVAAVKVEFSNVLAEARQQATALAGLLTKLGMKAEAGEASNGEEASPLARIVSLIERGTA